MAAGTSGSRAEQAVTRQIVISWPRDPTEEVLLRNLIARIVRRGGRVHVQ